MRRGIPTGDHGISVRVRGPRLGLVLGFSALALLSWQTAAMGGAGAGRRSSAWRRVSLTLSSHYYGVFVLLPIALGEMVRTLERRRLDAPVWAALLVSVAPLRGPGLSRSRCGLRRGVLVAAAVGGLPEFYSDLLAPALLPAAALLIVGSVVVGDAAQYAARTR